MDTQLKEGIMGKWLKYFPEQEMPIAVFYADDLHGSELVEKPKENPRGYTCMFAQLAKVHRGRSVAFSKDKNVFRLDVEVQITSFVVFPDCFCEILAYLDMRPQIVIIILIVSLSIVN